MFRPITLEISFKILIESSTTSTAYLVPWWSLLFSRAFASVHISHWLGGCLGNRSWDVQKPGQLFSDVKARIAVRFKYSDEVLSAE